MGDRFRYARPRSPVMYNPARSSLPINVYSSPVHEHHMHVVPTGRREVISNPRSSASSVSTAGPVTTTTYKITADPPSSRTSSTRDSSRTRRSTLDSNVRPTVVATAPRTHHRPVVHSATTGRPASPLLKNPYRSSEEEYYSVPATSKHGHHHRKRYSATMDNADMHRLAKERDAGRLRTGAGREERAYTGTTRSRPIYAGSAVRHADTVAADYGDNGYGYTNPRDLVQYDLNNPPAPRHHARRDSVEGGRAPRPSSITSYQDLATPRVPYDTRERGPPPSTRGFDRIQPRAAAWEQPAQVQMPAVPPPPPMDPIRRPARVDPPFEPEIPRRKESLTRRDRLAPLYHNEPRRGSQRDDYYETRDDDRRERPHRHERYEDSVEQRGFGIRPERPDRPERVERVDRVDRVERSERSPPDDRDYKEHKEHKGGKEALATGVSIAGAALGVNALKKTRSHEDRDDPEDRDESRRRRRGDDDYYDDEPRRRREPRDEREPVDLGGRDPRERRHRDSDLPPPPPGPHPGREMKPESPVIDLSGRDPRERHNSRDDRPRDDRPRDERPRDERLRDIRDERERDSDLDLRDRDRARRHRSEASVAAAAAAAASAAAVAGTAIDTREDSPVSDDAHPRSRREPRLHRESAAAPAPFNPKDTMDLKALKEALNKNEATASKEPVLTQRTPRESVSKDPRELADIRTDLNSSSPRGREPSTALAPSKENRQLRVVSPPREKVEEKPVKGILRTPREKFPEDPSPIREGVAPLKDAKKDGVPPDARWTKISRKLVNPAALEAGKERFEERDDFVIVLRVLSRDEVQGYAEVTERIRGERFLNWRR